ncbi:prolactin regulatory element-binding protein [Pelomyxa schiedti]|nr:prolactin regulatory element-binding protein [Pelomyxa schiedti]
MTTTPPPATSSSSSAAASPASPAAQPQPQQAQAQEKDDDPSISSECPLYCVACCRGSGNGDQDQDHDDEEGAAEPAAVVVAAGGGGRGGTGVPNLVHVRGWPIVPPQPAATAKEGEGDVKGKGKAKKGEAEAERIMGVHDFGGVAVRNVAARMAVRKEKSPVLPCIEKGLSEFSDPREKPVLLLLGAENTCTLALASPTKFVKLGSVVTVARPDNDPDSEIEQKVVCFDRSGERFFTGSTTGELCCWSIDSLSKLYECKGHQKQIVSLSCSKSGTMLASASFDNTCRIWDTTSGKLLSTLLPVKRPGVCTKDAFTGCRFINNDTALLTTEIRPTKACYLSKWLAAKDNNFAMHKSVLVAKWSNTCFDTSPSGKYAAIGVPENQIFLFSTHNLSRIACIENHGFIVTGVSFAPYDTHVLSVGLDNALRWAKVEPLVRAHRNRTGCAYISLSLFILLLAMLFYYLFL